MIESEMTYVVFFRCLEMKGETSIYRPKDSSKRKQFIRKNNSPNRLDLKTN